MYCAEDGSQMRRVAIIPIEDVVDGRVIEVWQCRKCKRVDIELLGGKKA